MTVNECMKANPRMTYGYAVGYVQGLAAADKGLPLLGLSSTDWAYAGDDYAQGYRKGYREKTAV